MPPTVSNRLLTSLSPGALELLTSRSVAVALPFRMSLYQPEQLPRFAFFITSGIASVVAPMIEGGIAEVEILGYEGLVGRSSAHPPRFADEFWSWCSSRPSR